MAIGAILSAGASIFGGLFQGGQANKAARAQEGIAREQIAMFRDAQQQQTNALAPYLSGGNAANAAYLYELGLGPRPTVGGTAAAITTIPGTAAAPAPAGGANMDALQYNLARKMAETQGGRFAVDFDAMQAPAAAPQMTPTMYEVNGQRFGTLEDAQAFAAANPTGGTAYGDRGTGFMKTPGYDFRMRQGMDALESSAAARGRLLSGATMQAATEFGQDFATSEYTPYLNRLEGLSGRGQNAAAGQGVIAGQGAANVGNALGSIGDARSAGYIAKGNAFSDGIDNAISAYSYFNNRPGGGQKRSGQLFSGNSWGA